MEVHRRDIAEVVPERPAVNALSVRCPTCERMPGRQCVTPPREVAGTVLPCELRQPHIARLELAKIRGGFTP